MKIESLMNKFKPLLWGALTLAGVYFVLSYAHYVGIAHAAEAVDPQVTVAAGGNAAIEVWIKDGPLWAGLLVVMYGLRTFLDRQHFLAQGRTLSLLTGLAMVGAAIANWHFSGAPLEGILTAAFAAFALFSHSQLQPKPAATEASGTTGAVSMLAVLLLGGMLVTQTGCTAAQKTQLQTGAAVAINCEVEDLKPLVAELLPLATQYVLSVVSSDGKAVDTAALSKAWGTIKSDQGRCALATAIAVLATPAPKTVGAPAAAALEVDPTALRAAYSQVRAAHGWGDTRTSHGVL